MIKAKQGNTLIFGLSDEIMRRLKNNEPIKFNLSELGAGDMDVVIFNGKDEQSMQQAMKSSIHPYKTTIVDHRAAEGN